MDTATGTVRAVIAREHGQRAIVDVDVAAACARCAAGKGCGAGLLGGQGRVRQVEAALGPGIEVAAGDRVEIALRPRDLLHAAVVVYVPPLGGGALGAALAYGIAGSDMSTAAATLIGMGLGILASRLYLKRTVCLERYTPAIERALPAGIRTG